MASILAPDNTAATSTDVVLAAGETATLGVYSAADGQLAGTMRFLVLMATPGADNVVAELTNHNRAITVAGPGTFRVKRLASDGTAFGVFSEV